MKELTECKDLRKNKRVIAAWEKLTGGCAGMIHVYNGKTAAWVTYIPDCIEKVAFDMRDACVNHHPTLCHVFAEHIYHQRPYEIAAWWVMPAESWIIAGTLSWEATQ